MILEFFIAFFGLIYLAIRMSGEKVTSDTAEKERSKTASAYKQWSEAYTDTDLERELRGMVEDAERYDDVWLIIKDDYAQMPSQSNKGYVPITYFWNTRAYPNLTTKQQLDHLKKDREDVLRLLMAHYGKILVIDSINHIAATQPGARVDPRAYQFCAKQYDYMVRLSKVSEDNNGPKIVFHAATDKRNHELSERMHEQSIGEYWWENPLCSL